MQEQPDGAPLVLVVDDDAGVRSLLYTILTHNGFAVLAAASGKEAVEQYRQQAQQIRLVLLDVQMPGMDGLQTLEALRRVDPSVRCCFMTADTGTYSIEELQERAEAVFSKPFRTPTLIQNLRLLLLRGAFHLVPTQSPLHGEQSK